MLNNSVRQLHSWAHYTLMLFFCIIQASCLCFPQSPARPKEVAEPEMQGTGGGFGEVIICHWGDPIAARLLQDRLATFRISEAEALQLATRAYAERVKKGLPVEAMDKRPLAIIGNSYLFGKPHKTKTVLSGYLVDGKTGEVRWLGGTE